MTNLKNTVSTLCFVLAIGGGTYAAAQGMGDHHRAGMGGDKAGMGMGMGMRECPMMQTMDVALDATVEKTADGATLHITAKKPEDAAKVQELAQRIADHLKQGCPMRDKAAASSQPSAAPTTPPAAKKK